jgi:K+-sensing histidine kinase KdpD
MARYSPAPPVEPGPHYVLECALRDFKRSVEITRDVRFQANLRLSARQRLSAYVVSTLSLFVIALSLIPNIIELKVFQSQILLGCSVVLSVFVIFTSLIDSAQNFFHQGELLHQCARKIATINHELKNIDIAKDPSVAAQALIALEKQYQLALDECPINHENVDYYHSPRFAF